MQRGSAPSGCVRETPVWAEIEAALPVDGLGNEDFVIARRGNQPVVADGPPRSAGTHKIVGISNVRDDPR